MSPIPIFLVGGGLLYLLMNRSSSTPFVEKKVEPPKPAKSDSTKVEPATGMPPNGVVPGVTMSLKRAQEILIKLGYDLGKTGADGVYGKLDPPSMTRKALLAYQGKNGLSTNGFLDQPTADQLASESIPIGDSDTTMKSVGYEMGYVDGYGSHGLSSNLMTRCVGYGATDSSGGCNPTFVGAYNSGFKSGAFKAGYDAYQVAAKGDDAPMGNEDFNAGWTSAYDADPTPPSV